ncbi:MAG: TolC family protein [Spirochaetaceae bacterium]|jgi:outer membrane protein TolC|nr:TolC family protein [Spirochaetaceae bacterium]
MSKMMYGRTVRFLMGALVFFLPWGIFGQESGGAAVRRLSPDEAVDLAIQNNLSLEVERINAGTKKRASDLSWNRFVPGVTVAGILTRDNEKTTGTVFIPSPPSIVSYEAPQWHLAGRLGAELAINLAMFEAMRTVRLDYEGGLITYEAARAQLEQNVRKAYYQILLAEESVKLNRENFANAERRVSMARDNYQAGLAPELSLLQAQVSRENLRPVIDQAENGLKVAMAQFAMSLGLEYDTQFEFISIEDDLELIPLDVAELISKAASGRPDILALKQTILTLESQRRALKFANLTPSLNLSWDMTRAFTEDPWKTSWFSDNWARGGSLTITLAMRLHSLLPFSPDYQGIKDADDRIRTANIALAQRIRGTEIEIYNTVLTLERTRTSAEAQRLTIAMAEQAYRLTEEAYRAGLQDLLEVQNAELALHQARLQMLEQNFNYRIGLIDLEYAIGVPFGTLSSRGSE